MNLVSGDSRGRGAALAVGLLVMAGLGMGSAQVPGTPPCRVVAGELVCSTLEAALAEAMARVEQAQAEVEKARAAVEQAAEDAQAQTRAQLEEAQAKLAAAQAELAAKLEEAKAQVEAAKAGAQVTADEKLREALLMGPVVVWTNKNMGPESGLDADTLDGRSSEYFLLAVEREAAARIAGDAVLGAALDAEAAARGAADAAEAAVRAAADSAEASARAASDAAEAQARAVADEALSGRTTSLEGLVNGGNFRGTSAALTGGATFGGLVGIGTTNPKDNLHVAGGVTMEGVLTMRSHIPGGHQYEWYPNIGGLGTFGLHDRTAGRVPFLVGASGNVGLGTTAPEQQLHVAGAGASLILQSTTPANSGLVFKDAAGANKAYVFYSQGAGALSLNRDGSLDGGLHLDGANRLGIGTSNPDFRLVVDSPDDTLLAVKRGGKRLALLGDGGSRDSGDLFLYDATGALRTVIASKGDSYLLGGNVGIGTEPRSKLQVSGGYLQLDTAWGGPPPAGDCDEVPEVGRMIVVSSGSGFTDPFVGLWVCLKFNSGTRWVQK